MVKTSAIYKIYFNNNVNDFYIGSAVDFYDRKIRHTYHLKKQIHKNKILQRAYNKYGVKNIIFSILETVSDMKLLIDREQFYINNLNPKFNILRKAGSCLGYKHSESVKKYLHEINIGKKMTMDQNIKNSIAQKGNKNAKGTIRSKKFRENISNKRKRFIMDKITGKIYAGVESASNEIGLKYSTLYAKLSGKHTNNTNLIFL